MRLENQTMTDADLATCRPVPGEGGRVLRAYCPFHSSDHQRSLRVDLTSGRFHCFACEAWGYTEEARKRFGEERAAERWRVGPERVRRPAPQRSVQPVRRDLSPARPDLTDCLHRFQAALAGGPGEAYLLRRGIPLRIAQQYGVGYAARGEWPHPSRDWRSGRLVFPLLGPAGTLINLYGRAVGDEVPKADRHDILPGDKPFFNTTALTSGDGPLYVCEGVFDALSLLAAGCNRVVAIIGVDGWRCEWASRVRSVVFALDADPTGQRAWRDLARQEALLGKEVAFLPPEAYGGYKDVNEAWVAGTLVLGNGRQRAPSQALVETG